MPWFRFVTRHPWPVLAGALLACLGSIAPVTGLRINNSPESWLLKDDPGLEAYREYKEEFATDEYMVLGYDAPSGVLSDDALAMVERITERLENLDGVLRVTNVANVEEMRADGDDLKVGPLVRPPLGEDQRRGILHKLTTDPLLAGSLAGRDGKSGAIVIKCDAMQEGDRDLRFRLLDEIRAATADERFSFYLSGAVAFDAAMFKAMVRDQNVLTPLMLVVFVVVLGLLFRTPSGVLLPSCTVGTAVLWTFALVGLSGQTVNVVMSMLTVVLLAIGVADSVHFLTEYQEERARGQCKEDAIVGAGSTVFTPCLFTSVTTALGFLGLLLIRVAPLREFGVFAAVGSILAFCATMTIVPAALQVLPDTRRAGTGADSPPSHGEGLRRIFGVVARYRVLVVVGSAAFMALGVAGMPRVTTSANWYEYLADDHPTRLATDFIEKRIGGVYTLEMLVAPPDGHDGPEPMREPSVLNAIETMQTEILRHEHAEGVLSPVDFVKTMNRVMNGDLDEHGIIPQRREVISQLLLLYEMDAPDGELYEFLNFDSTRARLTVRAKMSESANLGPLVEAVRGFAKTLRNAKIIPTGLVLLYDDVESYMLTGMVKGFCAAFLAVSIMMVVLLRSLRHGLLAMIPAALPVIFVVGMTGWLSISLGTMSAMMGNVALGVAVDNAIHLLTRYQGLRKRGLAPADAIATSTTVVGRPVLYTTIVLCLGFSILGFSEMIPGRMFGLLTASILFGSLVGSLVTLPATVLLVDRHFGGPRSPRDQVSRRAKKTDPTR